MPGLWGLVSDGPSDELAALSQAMEQRLRHHDFYRVDRYSAGDRSLHLGRASLGLVNAFDLPAFNEHGSLLAMMEGELYDYGEQRRRLESAGHTFRGESHAEAILHGFEQSGRNFFRDLRGSFAAAIWDKSRRQMILANDRFGIKPLYYARAGGRLIFASEIKAILADPSLSRSMNRRSVAQFFTFGQLLGEDTFFEDVTLLPAAGWLTYEPESGRMTLDRYGRLGADQRGPWLRGDEALDCFDDAFGRSTARCVSGPNRLGVALSGGLDSRTMLAAIDTDRTSVVAASLGMDGSIDVRSAQQMARLARIPHHRYQLDGTFLQQFEGHLRRMVHLTDGHYLCQCIVMPTLQWYRELGIEVLLRGHAGELLHMDKAYNYSLDREALAIRDEGGLEAWLYRHLRAYMLEGVDGPLFTPELQGALEPLARDSLRDCLRESEGVDPPAHRIWHLFVGQRLRREIAQSLVEFGSLVETRLPFVDNDLIDLVFRTPPELKVGESIQAHILRRRRPEYLEIPNANTGVRVGAGRLARTLGKGRLKVLSKLRVRGYQPYERLGLWLRQDLRPVAERILLSERCRDRGIFEPHTVESIIRQHQGGERNHTFLLMALMIFEQGQREFFDGDDHPGQPDADAELAPELVGRGA